MTIKSFPLKVFGDLAKAILDGGAIQAIKYFSPKLSLKATRKLFNGKIDKRDRQIEIVFTVGSPNFAERRFIHQAVKAGEPFPIKKLQLKWLKK